MCFTSSSFFTFTFSFMVVRMHLIWWPNDVFHFIVILQCWIWPNDVFHLLVILQCWILRIRDGFWWRCLRPCGHLAWGLTNFTKYFWKLWFRIKRCHCPPCTLLQTCNGNQTSCDLGYSPEHCWWAKNSIGGALKYHFLQCLNISGMATIALRVWTIMAALVWIPLIVKNHNMNEKY